MTIWRLCIVVTAASLVALQACVATAAVIFTPNNVAVPAPPVDGTQVHWDVDIDGGANDVRFLSQFIRRSNLIVGVSQDVMGLNGAAIAKSGFSPTPLPPGAIVDSTLTLDAAPIMNYESWTSGAFLGLRLQQPDGLHYGFLHLQYEPNGASYTIGDYAYESTPNTPIVTIPEPASAAVMLAIVTGALLRRHDRQLRRRHRQRS